MAKKLETQEEISKEKILKELEEELENKKEDIIKELEEKVEKEVSATVNKRMREEEKRILRGKNRKIIRLNILIILLIAIIGYFGYCLYDIDYFKIRKPIENDKVVDKKEESKDDQKTEEPKIDYIKDYGYLVDRLVINDEAIYELMSNSEINNNLKLKIGYKNLENKIEEDGIISFNSGDLKDQIENIFGETNYKDNTFTYNKTRFMYYDDKYIGYKEKEEDSHFIYLITNGEFEEDELTFEIICGKLISKELFNLENTSITKKYNNENLEKYQDKLNHIKITFVKEKDNFILDSIKVK